ncbi:alpha/beta hydrolase [Rhizobacter sp. LjRoot28]|uniref:alpha/beta fold hydrolase n=1 Tax=Rhizobacter sp. LjRoot28 TaxID=3342309 RepID=UPI003ECE8579
MTSETSALPTVFVPGLFCTPRVYEAQLSALWTFGPVMVADHRGQDSMAAIARGILAAAPPVFGLAGISMGGYVAFEILRQAPDRVKRLALLNTSARPDTPEATERRRQQMADAESGKFDSVIETTYPKLVAPARAEDAALKAVVRAMGRETGAPAFIRQQQAILSRIDSRPLLPSIACPTLVLTGEHDQLIPPALSEEMAAAIPGARLVSVPDCGHLSTIEQPEAVNRALVDCWSA